MFSKNHFIVLLVLNAFKALLTAGAALWIILFLAGEMTRISNTLSERRQVLLNIQLQNTSVNVTEEQLAKVRTGIVAIEQAFIPIEEIGGFINAIKNLATTTGISQGLLNFGALEAPDEDGISAASFEYSVSADIATLPSYLEAFEHLPYFASITSIALNAPSGTDWSETNNIILKGKLYLRTNE